MTTISQFTSVRFHRFKAFEDFVFRLRHFNILVGPNNAGKSTILAAFRILAAAMRRAGSRRAEVVQGPEGAVYGYKVDLEGESVAEENIFYNYDDSEPAYVRFSISNGNELLLYFSEYNSCVLIPEVDGWPVRTPSAFLSCFNCKIGFVPILGPVEHNEQLYEMKAARLALFNYRAARNFRNIWFHYPEKFDEFRLTLQQTWPGMDIQRPEITRGGSKPLLHMFCPEERIPREIFWSGFGFQVWCQMLTHVIQSKGASLFLIDEPDIYLHSDLQRQLLGILRNLGPDILIATHSIEIITEADPGDIVLIDKRRKQAKRVRDVSQLSEVFSTLGSNLNPILTQVTKTRRVVFVEGKDFQILSKFARKLGHAEVGNRSAFAVVPVEGFNPERIKHLKAGMEQAVGRFIAAAAIFDRDFRSEEECKSIIDECSKYCEIVKIHKRKEIENFLLIPAAVQRAIEHRAADYSRRSGKKISGTFDAKAFLSSYAKEKKAFVASRYLSDRRVFAKKINPLTADSVINEKGLHEFEAMWEDEEGRLMLVSGKDAISAINMSLNEKMGINITSTGIIDSMNMPEVPGEMKDLIQELWRFSKIVPRRDSA